MESRTDEPELLDGDSVSMADRLEALGQLPLVNRFLGGARAVLKDLAAVVAERNCEPGAPFGSSGSGIASVSSASLSKLPSSHRVTPARLRLLDVGCGAGDIPEAIVRWAKARGLLIAVVALDRDCAAIQLGAQRAARLAGQMTIVRGDALRLAIADQSVDVVTASMFCHHFFGDQLVALVRELTRVARVAVVINDLHRHRAALWGFRLASRVFLRGHVVRHDGDVSVRRGFVPDELRALAKHFPEFRWSVRRRFAFRVCMIGRRERS